MQCIERVGNGGRQCGSINNMLCCRILSARVKVYTQSERKREREAQMFSSHYSKATSTTRLQKQVYVIADLGQLPFTLFKKIA